MSRTRKQLSRRRFLAGAGALGLSLPFLESFSPTLGGRGLFGKRARAQSTFEPLPNGPRRFLLFYHPQGTVMDAWAPSGSETSFSMGPILAPLEAHKDKLLVIGGMDNAAKHSMNNGNGHITASCSILTCSDYANPNVTDNNELLGGAASIDQVVAQRIGNDTPYSSINVAVGANGTTHTSKVLYAGSGDPVVSKNNPLELYAQLFADEPAGVDEVAALAARRQSVLSAVKGQFGAFEKRLGALDKQRLDQHYTKLLEIEARVTQTPVELATCSAPQLGISSYQWEDEPANAKAHIDMMVMALACQRTRVGTLLFANGHSPTFPWLGGGSSIVPNNYDNWHSMVHDLTSGDASKVDQVRPLLIEGFTWYTEMFAYLLEQMALTEDPEVEGASLLDTTLVMWTTDFGNGQGHNGYKIPYVLAGNAGGGPTSMGRWLDYMEGGPNANYQKGAWQTGNLYTSVLHAFGYDDAHFGPHYASWGGNQTGPLPGVM